jgi:DNA-binding response OmpR family regulator
MAERTRKADPASRPARRQKKTVVLYSPDLNFCFSLSLLFQDRYDVITTTNLGMLEEFVERHAADLVLMDAVPSEGTLERIERLKRIRCGLPIIMVYVYSSRDFGLDRAVREKIDSVFYKPFEVDTVSSRIDCLLNG